VFGILFAMSFSHLINDTLQSLIPAIYPMLKEALHLDFRHIGLITLTNQLTASILQPFVGFYTDRRPQPYSLAIGMASTLFGLVLLSLATSLGPVLVAVAFVGLGSSIFHPEASRVAHLSSGGQTGFAQAVFQVGGNAGSSLGPLLAAAIIVTRGQGAIMWFSLLALLGIVVLTGVGRWYGRILSQRSGAKKRAPHLHTHRAPVSRGQVIFSLGILMILVFSKYFYLTSMTSYYTFFVMEKFGLSVQNAQIHLFIFLFAIAAGTFLGGPIGDRIGRKVVICVHPWRGAFRHRPALRQSFLDGHPRRHYRTDLVFRFLRDSRLRPGTGSRQSRVNGGPLFRSRLRHGRNRLGCPGSPGRSLRHAFRLSDLLLPSSDRLAHGISPQPLARHQAIISSLAF
jgi:FSR family fosmidomycin resistance protein-like MFS transporter